MNTKIIHYALLAGVASASLAVPASAQQASEQNQRGEVEFDIPAQDLDRALKDFASQSQVDLVYSPDLVSGLVSQPVTGRHTVPAALKLVLRGTGLKYREVSANVFALQAASKPGNRAGSQSATTPFSGRLTNSTTGAPMPGARLTIPGTGLESVSDQDGRFYFPAVPARAQQVVVEYLGEPTQQLAIPADAAARRNSSLAVGDANAQIIVRGYRSSLQLALNQQLTAPNSSTIVSSDLLGSFPAENVAEALRRVPGVAFGRSDATGEGTDITVRGFSSEAINIQLNGLEMQGTGFERTIDLSGFLADNISQITIHKSLLPSMESNGSGGLVEIETKSGLDYGDFKLSLGLEGETNFDRDFGEEWQANGTLAKRLTDNFGVAATVQYRKSDRRNYDASISSSLPAVLPDGYNSVFNVPASQQFPFDEAITDRLISGVGMVRRDRNVEDLTASFNAAWEIGANTTLRFDAQRIQQDTQTNSSRTLAGYLTTAVDAMPIPELGGETRRRTVLNTLRPNLALSTVDETYTQDTLSLRGETRVNNWEFKYKAGYGRAVKKSNNFNVSALGNSNPALADLIDPATAVTNPDGSGNPRYVDGGFVMLPNDLPVISLTQLGYDLLNDPGQYSLTSASRTGTMSPTNSYVLEGSARYVSTGSFLDYIEVGGKYDRSARKSQDDLFASTSTGSLSSLESYLRISGRETPLDFFNGSLFTNANLTDIGAGGYIYPFLSRDGLAQLFDVLPTLTADDPNTPFDENRFTYSNNGALDPILDGNAQTPAETVEKKLSGYIESRVEFGKFDLSGGVRVERFSRAGTTLTAPSVRTRDNVVIPRDVFIGADLVAFETTEGSHTTFTPSLLMNYRPKENIVARFHYNRTTVNPDFRLIRRNRQVFVDLRDSQNSVTLREANPDLRATTADNFEFDVSYYFRDSPGIVRAGFFYKNVKNNFTNVLFQAGGDDSVRDEVLDYFGGLATQFPEIVDFNADTVFLRDRPENGEGGTIYGFEAEVIRQLNFLPGFLSDFGVLGNVTYTTADFPTLLSGRNDDGTLGQFSLDRPLQKQSAWVYNASLNYQRGGFEGRLIYTYQDASPKQFEVHGLDIIEPSYSTLDLRMSYLMPTKFADVTFYLQGDDLLRGSTEGDLRSATSSMFNDGAANFFFPDRYQFNGGRTITLGVRASF